MSETNYTYEKFNLKIKIPEEIGLFMKAAHINQGEILDKAFWQMEVEDNVYFSHKKHPAEEGYVSDMPDAPLSKSRGITVLVHGFYLSSKKSFELSAKDFDEKDPLATVSCNLKSGWRMYFSFYD